MAKAKGKACKQKGCRRKPSANGWCQAHDPNPVIQEKVALDRARGGEVIKEHWNKIRAISTKMGDFTGNEVLAICIHEYDLAYTGELEKSGLRVQWVRLMLDALKMLGGHIDREFLVAFMQSMPKPDGKRPKKKP
jgi:hypothetical protein